MMADLHRGQTNRAAILRCAKGGLRQRGGPPAIFTRIRKHLVLTLARGENKDMLLFSRMQQPEQKIERTWQALLSTAPTPPLSDEELVG